MTSHTKSYRIIKRIRTPINEETIKIRKLMNSSKKLFLLLFYYWRMKKVLYNSNIDFNILFIFELFIAEKLNYSLYTTLYSWLIRLNNEEKNSKILHLIKILCISIRNNHAYFIFTEPPSKDFNVLNLESDHTVWFHILYRKGHYRYVYH